MADGFRGDHPFSKVLRVLAVHIDTADREVHCHTVIEAERSLQIDLHEGTEMRLLGLMELVPAVPASVLSVEKHVVRPAQDLRDPNAIRVTIPEVCKDSR